MAEISRRLCEIAMDVSCPDNPELSRLIRRMIGKGSEQADAPAAAEWTVPHAVTLYSQIRERPSSDGERREAEATGLVMAVCNCGLNTGWRRREELPAFEVLADTDQHAALVRAQEETMPSSAQSEDRPFADLSSSGLLWLINRVVFHPRGLALALTFDEDGQALGWHLLGDGGEPFWFDPEDDKACYAAAAATLAAALRHTDEGAGLMQQIVTDTPVPRAPAPPPARPR